MLFRTLWVIENLDVGSAGESSTSDHASCKKLCYMLFLYESKACILMGASLEFVISRLNLTTLWVLRQFYFLAISYQVPQAAHFCVQAFLDHLGDVSVLLKTAQGALGLYICQATREPKLGALTLSVEKQIFFFFFKMVP